MCIRDSQEDHEDHEDYEDLLTTALPLPHGSQGTIPVQQLGGALEEGRESSWGRNLEMGRTIS